jgi:hypothetical protein
MYQFASAIAIAIVVPIKRIMKLKTLLPLVGLIPMAMMIVAHKHRSLKKKCCVGSR